MSNNMSNQGYQNWQGGSGPQSNPSVADVQAAFNLLSISRNDPNQTFSAANREAAASLLSLSGYNASDIQELTQRLGFFILNGEGSNRQAAAQFNTTQPAHFASYPMINDCVSNIAFGQSVNPNHVQARPSMLGNVSLPQANVFYHSSDVPESVGRFVDMCARYGCSAETIRDILRADGTIVPIDYVFRRLGYGDLNANPNLRSAAGESWNNQTQNATTIDHRMSVDEEMTNDNDDQESRQS
jgi:hypothetical protein